ncbi:MAG TPA: PAS domain-containing sensor histidine kinase [Longimicrobiales bacterium]|nr:PAS domain-containing sensor histidine kinase [Longimicrobiales bacterium]
MKEAEGGNSLPDTTGKPDARDAPASSAPDESAQEESVALYRLLVESVRDYAIFALDPSGRVLTWNPGAQRFKGYTAEEIIGKHFSIFYPQAKIDEGHPAYELRVAAAEGRFEEEGWRLRKDGSRFWANVVITALRGPNGELVGFAKVTRDLTERRAAEMRAVEDARRIAEAEAANRARAEFLATMSHELRTPLNAIGGYVDLISLGIRGPVTEQQIDDLKRIRRSQQHLLGIINDLLNFSRIEAGHLTYDLEYVPLSEILHAVHDMVEPLAAAKTLATEWPKDVRSLVYVDRAKTEQILLNLLTNAIKFTPTGGRITIACRVNRTVASVEVTDTGIGIPSENLNTIFEPFVQVGRTHSSAHEGAGLGLAISRDLARGMGGELTAASTLGEGSTFTVTLPRAPSTASD